MSDGARRHGAGRLVIEHRFTSRHDGDLRVDLPGSELEPRRAAVAPTPWSWLDQVHGARVVTVTRPGEHAGVAADAAVTATAGATLAVHTADCAGVLFWSEVAEGAPTVIGAAHAGWRGLRDGVLEATVRAMADLGGRSIRWRLGPCISPAAYEFGRADLDVLRDRFGAQVEGRTNEGAPALDLRAAVQAALVDSGAEPSDPNPLDVACTASDPSYYSWRARADTGRQAAVIWMAAA